LNEIVLLTQPDCDKCKYVKGKIPPGFGVTELDIKTPDGMALAAFHELIGKHTPILIIGDEEVVEGAIPIKNRLKDLDKVGVKSQEDELDE